MNTAHVLPSSKRKSLGVLKQEDAKEQHFINVCSILMQSGPKLEYSQKELPMCENKHLRGLPW